VTQTATVHPLLLESDVSAPAVPVDVQILDLLRTFAREIPGVSSIVVSDPQGLPISALVRGPGATAATAMGTLLRTAAKSVTTNMGLPSPDDIIIQAGADVVLVRCLDGGITLLVVLLQDANLGLVKLELTRHAGELQVLLDQLQ
jgi:predicted regulator of Ras-like GTPase activity (Roadblock/LC7/MglB family)